jgi:transposase
MLTWEEDVEATALRKRGWTISAIARHLGRDRKTVRDYLNGKREVGRRRSSAPDVFVRFERYLRQRLADDPHGEPPWYPRRLLTLETRMEHGSLRSVPQPASVLARVQAAGGTDGRQLQAETGEKHGTIGRVAAQLGCGVESLRLWVNQDRIDHGEAPGTSTEDAQRIKELEQEVRELRRANAILKSASAFFAAELDRPQK